MPFERIEKGLIEGIKRHGQIINFVQELVYIKQINNQLEQAVFWLIKLPIKLQNTPKWLNKKADIENNRGNIEIANSLFRRSLILISKMPRLRQEQLKIINAKQHAEQQLLN